MTALKLQALVLCLRGKFEDATMVLDDVLAGVTVDNASSMGAYHDLPQVMALQAIAAVKQGLMTASEKGMNDVI